MTRVIACSIAKGSQGKTTTAVHLAAGLAATDRRVLLVGTDTQRHCADYLGIDTVSSSLYDFFTGTPASEAMTEARPGLFVMAGGEQIARLKRRLNNADERIEWQLRDQLASLLPYFHYLIIDSSPGWDVLGVNVMYASDEQLIPVTLEPLSMRGLYDHLKRVQRIQQHGGGRLKYVLPTMVDMRTLQSREIMEQLNERYSAVLCNPIRQDIRISESPAHGQTIWEYAPKSRSAEDYKNLIERVIADE